MKQYLLAWNEESTIVEGLSRSGFCSAIGCGYKDEKEPRGVLIVKDGKAIYAGAYNGEELDWDLRSDKESWLRWQKEGVGMAALGMAAMTGKLKFNQGDYVKMIKNPELAKPFVKSFSLMKKLN